MVMMQADVTLKSGPEIVHKVFSEEEKELYLKPGYRVRIMKWVAMFWVLIPSPDNNTIALGVPFCLYAKTDLLPSAMLAPSPLRILSLQTAFFLMPWEKFTILATIHSTSGEYTIKDSCGF